MLIVVVRSSVELSNLPSGKDLSDIVDISKKFDRGKVSKSIMSILLITRFSY